MDPSCLVAAKANFTLDLLPAKLGDVREGVREQLDSQLLRYSEDLDGVVMSYSNAVIHSKAAPVDSYFPLFRVHVTADVLLFKPRVGASLVGEVNKVGADYIGLLVLGVFNAAIGVQQIRPDLACDAINGRWVGRGPQKGHLIGLGSSVRFTVAGVRDQGGFFGISGSLLEPSTGELAFLAGGMSSAVPKPAPPPAAGTPSAAGAGPALPVQQQQRLPNGTAKGGPSSGKKEKHGGKDKQKRKEDRKDKQGKKERKEEGSTKEKERKKKRSREDGDGMENGPSHAQAARDQSAGPSTSQPAQQNGQQREGGDERQSKKAKKLAARAAAAANGGAAGASPQAVGGTAAGGAAMLGSRLDGAPPAAVSKTKEERIAGAQAATAGAAGGSSSKKSASTSGSAEQQQPQKKKHMSSIKGHQPAVMVVH